MDICVPYKKNRKTCDEELKYALRSIDKNFYCDRLFIVGDLPSWKPKGIEYIGVEDFPDHRESSIVNKLLTACNSGISKKFARWDDDHYLLKPLSEIKYWWKNTLKEWLNYPHTKGFYRDTIIRTKERLGDCKYFDIHTPIVFDRELFKEKMGFIIKEKPEILCKTTYCKLNEIEGEENPEKDVVINSDWVRWSINNVIRNRTFFSTGNHGFGTDMKRVLDAYLPKKSKWE